jgi:hypothetical protein
MAFLADWHSVALRTDLVSFFASIPIAEVQDAIEHRARSSAPTKRLCDMLTGFDAIPERSGLPHRTARLRIWGAPGNG